jgi:hypothetical protein
MPRKIRVELRPQDHLRLDFTQSSATHCVACDTPAGKLQIAPIESACRILNEWRQRPYAPESPPVFNVYVLGEVRDALEASALAELERCAPVLFAVESEEDAELLSAALRGHMARLNATFGCH